MTDEYRKESDSMGPLEVPARSLYGASTQRAVVNFPISGRTLPARFIQTLGLIKWACAKANVELGQLEKELGVLIAGAAREIAEGKWTGEFPLDVFQTGSGTSTNMNANEVIANRCSQMTGEALGSKKPVHPNDHVNLGQSSNDVIPATLHVSIALALKTDLIPALEILEASLGGKAEAWRDIVKVGRTHLMDATPVTMGQAFSGYARQIGKAVARCRKGIEALRELAIGGTAVGTGLNTHPEFGKRVCRILAEETGISFGEAQNHFEAQGSRDDVVEVAGHLTTVAVALLKIANDIRLLGSGPRAGLAELRLPATQPGSSIMPGKVNPVMCEMLIQVCHYTIGLCQTIVRCGQDGYFELNASLPLQAYASLEAIHCLANGVRTFSGRCIEGLEVDEERCRELLDRSLMLVTRLNPVIGYDKAAEVAKKAFAENKTLKACVLELGLLDEAAVDELLNPKGMV